MFGIQCGASPRANEAEVRMLQYRRKRLTYKELNRCLKLKTNSITGTNRQVTAAQKTQPKTKRKP